MHPAVEGAVTKVTASRSVHILDVSDFQSTVDWAAVWKAGIGGVYIKATEGLSWNSKMYAKHRAGASAVGVRVGAYHFARPDLHPYDPVGEAKHFAAIVGKPGRRDLKPVLDFETWGKNLTAAQHVSWARKFNAAIKDKLGLIPVFYSYSAFIKRMAPTSPIGSALWLADYGVNDGVEHPAAVPAPWKAIQEHQFTSNDHIAGIAGKVDMTDAPKLTPLLAYPVSGQL